MRTRFVFLKKVIPAICALSFFCGLLFAGVSLGPVNAIKNKVNEYNDKVRQDRINNYGEYIGAHGTITGVVRSAAGVPKGYTTVYVQGVNRGYTDQNGIYTVNVAPDQPLKLKSTTYSNVNGAEVDSIEYTVTAAKGETKTQDICFTNWNVLDSNISGSGNYSEDVKLAAAKSPYTVTGNFSCNNIGIDPGVHIQFSGSYSFNASGVVIASGTASQPIVFTSGRTSPAAGDYGTLQLGSQDNLKSTTMNHVNFEYGADYYIYGNADSQVLNCAFKNNYSGAVSLELNGSVKYSDFLSTSSISQLNIYGAPQISYCDILPLITAQGNAGQYSINHCNLKKGSGTVLSNNANWTIDATYNWWGSSVTATVTNFISKPKGSVTFQPFVNALIPGCGPQ